MRKQPALVVLILCSALTGVSYAQDDSANLEFEPESVGKSGPPSKTMQNALRLYESADYYSSSIELHKVIEGNSGDSVPNRQRAEFWMGKTLYHLGFYSASLSYFDRIVQKGEKHRYYNATLKWLASLSRKLPETAGILKNIGKYNRAELEQPALNNVRNELFYLLGRYHYQEGNFKDAIDLFRNVPENSPFFARAKFMEGITQVRLYQAKPAVEAFKVLLRTAREAPDTNEIKEYEELAVLSLARVFYSTHQYDLSVKYYEQIESDSPNWPDALFESSWAYFQRNGFSKALGNIHSLNSPFFENLFFPESLVLKSVIYFQNCLYDSAREAIGEFNSRYPSLMGEINQILKKYQDPVDFYEFALKAKDKKSGVSAPVERMIRGALADRTVGKTFGYVDELDRELKQVEKADPAWRATAIAGVILQDLTLQRSLAQNVAGDLGYRRLKRQSGEINELQKQAIKVEYEIINGQKNQLEASLRDEQMIAARTGVDIDLVPDDEHLYWPFDGQYWRDELGYYRFRIASKCSQ